MSSRGARAAVTTGQEARRCRLRGIPGGSVRTFLDRVGRTHDNGVEDRLLAGEVVVERALGDADGAQDVLDRGGLVPFGEEEAAGGVQDLRPADRGAQVLRDHHDLHKPTVGRLW